MKERLELFSDALKDHVQQKYSGRAYLPESLKRDIDRKLKACTPNEQLLMKFFYGTMPLRDAGEYEFEVFLGFVRHSLMLYETMEWCRNLPEEIFLHDVLYYRINSENIEDCRRFFYDRLIGRIREKTVREAALEINYWCAENGTYESSDIRTISPMTMYRSGKGRCGEESTFAVTAFRSVGIPARQVYTPKWAHCDDNHAWVEVYADGAWHFLGACEPEEVLDKGWFVNASSRALMVHARDFSDYKSGRSTACFRQEGSLFYHNITAAYTRTAILQIMAEEADQTPAENVKIAVEVLNGAEYTSIATLYTDKEGKASLCMGIGTVHLWAVKGARTAERIIHTPEERVLLTLEERELAEPEAWTDVDVRAPEEAMLHQIHLTREQKAKNRERLQAAAEQRTGRIDGYYVKKLAEKYPEETEILRLAAGNFDQIYQFLERDDDPDRRSLLHSLSEKDYKDARAELLEQHLSGALKYREEWVQKGELGIYVDYILCPRIFFEELTPFRKKIEDYFCEEEKEQFQKNPKSVWSYIKEKIVYQENEDYSTLYSTPAGTLKLGFGNPISQRILCVAICRTFGIPARLDPVTREAEIYKDGSFIKISGGEECKDPTGNDIEKSTVKAGLTLTRREGDEWIYGQNWTIGQYLHGSFVTLDYQGLLFKDQELKLSLEPGIYRILTTTRLPGGDQLMSECRLRLEPGQYFKQELRMRPWQMEQLFVSNQLEDFDVEEKGERKPISGIVKDGLYILAFLELGGEPTEHVLNEMYMHRKSLLSTEAGICFILGSHGVSETAAWKKATKSFPDAKIVYGDFDEIAEPAARRMYTDPGKLPLLIITKPGLTGIYACSGYSVGNVRLLLELLKMKQQSGQMEDQAKRSAKAGTCQYTGKGKSDG